MKVSLNWVKFINQKYKAAADPASDGVDALVEKIGAQLGAVEEVISLGERYKGIFVVKVISAEKHPNADKLKVCWIDDGGVVKDVSRNEKGHVHVVCGAPNIAAGQLVAWLPPGSTVPSTFDKDPFVLEAREIRGQISNGMIASAKELALGDDHTGILVLDGQFTPGEPLTKALDLDDCVIDIENKMFTHRPDLFGQLGIARELAGIQGQVFKSPNWYKEDADVTADGRSGSLKLEIKNDVPNLVPRFCAVAIKDIKVGPSPAWLQVRLSAVGIRPINNIVDVTNFYMVETAQPLHAYDYDKLKTGILGARLSRKGEKLSLLNGKELTLDEVAVVITDGNMPVGLGGIMGGADTEVDENTRNIVLECATFDMNRTRKTAMAYGLFTDAATRFTKNQSPRQNRAVIAKAAEDILRVAGGRIASPLADVKSFEVKEQTVKVGPEFINSRLGLDLSAPEIKKILENVEFLVGTDGGDLTITAPFWRTDIEIPEDIVEEVGRLYGYDKLPVVLPKRDLTPAVKDSVLSFKSRLRSIMRRAGANEVLTYSFVHESLLKKAGQDSKHAYHIRNALSPDLQYYRLSLIPSLLDRVQPNIRSGFDRFALYEIGKGHVKDELDAEKLPKEYERLAMVLASKERRQGSPYYAAKRICDYLLGELGIEADYRPLTPNPKLVSPTYYELARSAEIISGDVLLGRIGEFRPDVAQGYKLPGFCAGFELHIKDLMNQSSPTQYLPLNRFPELEQDFTLRSPAEISYGELYGFMTANISGLSKPHGYGFTVRPLDIYQKDDDKKHKQTTWRIILWHPERTLTTQETNKLLDQVAGRAKQELNAERV